MTTKNIVLVHGWGGSAARLYPLAEALKSLGWNTLVPKMPGFDIDPPKEVWTLYDYQKYIDMQARNKFKGDDYYMFGHSFGGRIAILSAFEKQRKLKGIILCSTGGISRRNIIYLTTLMIFAKMGRVLLIFPLTKKIAKKALYRIVGEHDYEGITNTMLKKTFKNIINFELRLLLPRIKLPTLILWGDKDSTTPVKDAYIVKAKVANSVLFTFANQTHRLPYKEYNKLAKTIDQWQKTLT